MTTTLSQANHPTQQDMTGTLAAFPLIPGSKEPAVPWRNTPAGRYPAVGNYGIALRPTDLILDFDPRNYPPGRSMHDEFFKAYPSICTRIVKTPRGGLHVYLRKSPELRLKKKQKDWPGVDFLSDGHYVCGPGTSTVAGKDRGTGTYELLGTAPICDVPKDFLAGLEQQTDQAASQGSEETLSCEQHFKSLCETAEPATRGSRGITAFKIAAKARDLGLPADLAYQHMRDSWLTRWAEPFTETELHVQVEHAYRYAKNAPGCKTPEATFTPEMAQLPESNATSSAPTEIAWSEPKEIKTELSPVPPMLPDMIPEPFRPWLSDIVSRMPIPLDFVAVAAICMTGSVIGAGCGIRPKRKDNWTVVPNLWGGVVAQPGRLKSPAIVEALRPLERLTMDAQKLYEEKLAEYEVNNRSYEARKKAFEKAMEQAAKDEVEPSKRKKSIQGEAELKMDDLQERQSKLQPPQPPVCRRYTINDATVPKLAELLKQNTRGLLVFRDELIGELKRWDKPGNESDRAFYLEGWNGSGSHVDDRIGRGTIVVPNMCISLFGGIQPGKLLSYLYDAVKSGGNDGLVQRFQLLVYPDSTDWWLHDEYPDRAAKDRAFKIIAALTDMDFINHGAMRVDELERPSYHFDDTAQAYFFEWWQRLEKKIANCNEEPIIAEHLAKFRSLMPSLALIFHLIEVADSKASTSPFGTFAPTAELTGSGTASSGVPLRCAEMAASWCEYLEAHARRIYGLLANVADKAAASLADKIKKGRLKESFTLRDVYRKEWSLLDTPELVKGACEDLIQAGWLTSEGILPSGCGGRSTTIFRIHPALTGGDAGSSWRDKYRRDSWPL